MYTYIKINKKNVVKQLILTYNNLHISKYMSRLQTKANKLELNSRHKADKYDLFVGTSLRQHTANKTCHNSFRYL